MRKSERSKISTVGQFWCKRGIYHALHEEIRAQQDIDRRSESKKKEKRESWLPLLYFRFNGNFGVFNQGPSDSSSQTIEQGAKCPQI